MCLLTKLTLILALNDPHHDFETILKVAATREPTEVAECQILGDLRRSPNLNLRERKSCVCVCDSEIKFVFYDYTNPKRPSQCLT